jgi:hypothetical protein
MTRLRSNFLAGTLSAGITNVATTISSSGFAALPAVVAPDYLMLVLDPTAVAGDPEIIKVTAHTALTTTVTVARAQEVTSARAHLSPTRWAHGATAEDWTRVDRREENVLVRGAVGDGSTDNTDAIQEAIGALGSRGGRVILPLAADDYVCTGPLDLADSTAVTISGASIPTGGAPTASRLLYTGTGDRFVDARSANGLQFENLHLVATEAGFAGKLLDLAHSGAGSDAQVAEVRRCIFDLTSADPTSVAVNCDKLISSTVQGNLFTGGRALDGGSSYANVLGVIGNTFVNCTSAPIHNPHQSWTILGNTFEQMADGSAGAVSASARLYAPLIAGNWCGDSDGTGTWFDLYATESGLVTANYITHADIGVSLTASGGTGLGLTVTDNEFYSLTTAVDVSGVGSGGDVVLVTVPNRYNTVTTRLNAGATVLSAESTVHNTTGVTRHYNRFQATALITNHAGGATPTGGQSGEIQIANGKIWVNDAGTWKSVAVA